MSWGKGEATNDSGDGRASYDLHLHTYWSYDATAHPEGYFRHARALGVRCVAITDHHVLDSLGEVLRIARAYPDVRAIPAAELTVMTSIGPVDLLCYGFQHALSGELRRVLEIYHAWQRDAGEAWCRGLQALGYDYTDAHRRALLESYRPRKAIDVQGYTHVKNRVQRRYFLERGFIASESEYWALIQRARERVPFPPYPDVAEVIPAVRRCGAVVAIAHPYRYFCGHDLRRMDALRDECCLDGVECAHPGVPLEYTALYRTYCERHGLFSVGGSDCHMDAEIEGSLAGHGGADAWLDEFLGRVGGP
jgi:predicted metal-dependent phosphoesterase TrpH